MSAVENEVLDFDLTVPAMAPRSQYSSTAEGVTRETCRRWFLFFRMTG